MELPVHVVVALGGALLGVIFGVTVHRTNFCMMGAVADLALSGSGLRLRAWLLAISTAMASTQLLALFGLIDLHDSLYLRSNLDWLSGIVGGLLFGFGMVIACGCGSRSLVNLGTGDLRALITVLFLGLAAYATMRGLFAQPRSALSGATAIDLTAFGMQSQAIPELLGLEESNTLQRGFGIILAAFAALVLLTNKAFRSTPRYLAASGIIGLLVAGGWLVTGILGANEFEPTPLASLTFAAPVGNAIIYTMTYTGAQIDFGIAVVAGVAGGAALSSLSAGNFRWQGFEDVRDLARYMLGGILMGVGGVMALGCTVGQGVTGVSTLALGSWIALTSILTGGLLGVRYLEHGTLLLALRALTARNNG
ncbi:MAG: YeeE/YedE family protein [Gammaproteobacteria bacterium]|nr:YeeE/YedE family protein [Gammaproteobacteria bacterium]